MTTYSDHAYRERLNPENLERIQNMYHVKTRPEIENMYIAAGFHIVKSYDVKRNDRVFGNGANLCSFLWATTHGAFDLRLVTEGRLREFCARYASRDAGAPSPPLRSPHP